MDDRAGGPAQANPGNSRHLRTRRRFLGELGTLGVRATGLRTLTRIGLTVRATPMLASAAGLAAACGTGDPAAPTIVPLFSPDRVLVAGRPQRIPLAVVASSTADGQPVALPDDDAEILITIRLGQETLEQIPVRGRVVDHDHVGEADPNHQHADLFRYYPLRATLPAPGIYDLTIEVAGTRSEVPIQAFDPSETTVPLAGDAFPMLATPTIADPGDVDPLCTRFERCPFHEHDAADLIGQGRPLAVLVATPAYCSTAYCGPVLETLIDALADRSDIDAVHVEVYANPTEVGGNIADPAIRLAPAVEQLGLTFEPSLFLIAGDGTLIDRIDNVFDRTELDGALADLVR